MKMRVSPLAWPVAAQDSSVRTVVVPTATTRPPRARASAMACCVAAGTSYHSLCMVCSARFSVLTGWKVPAPTCSVTLARRTPRASSSRQQRLVEMQRRRRRRHRARVPGEDGLVALDVLRRVAVLDVGRQRHMAMPLHQGMGIVAEGEPEQRAVGVGPAALQGGGEAALHGQRRAHRRLLAHLHVRGDLVVAQHALDQQFGLAAGRLLAEQARLHDLGVVEHQQVARLEQRRAGRERCDRPAAARCHRAGASALRSAAGCWAISSGGRAKSKSPRVKVRMLEGSDEARAK